MEGDSMTIERIDDDLCNGCGICVNICSVDVLRMDKKRKKAVIKYPEECTCCAFWELECPQEAIYVSPAKYSPIMVSWYRIGF